MILQHGSPADMSGRSEREIRTYEVLDSLGLMNDREKRVTLIIDEDVLKEDMFGCHPCENTSSIRFSTKDLTEKILPALGISPVIVRLGGAEVT